MIISIGKFRFETNKSYGNGTIFHKFFDNIVAVLMYGSTGLVWQGQDRKLLWQFETDHMVSGKTLLTIARPLVLFGNTNWRGWDVGVLQNHYDTKLELKNQEFPMVGFVIKPIPNPDPDNTL